MTGKQLKEWAAVVPDGATIEQVENPGYSYEKWKPLDPTSVRAILLLVPEQSHDSSQQEEPAS